jgi:hypothetical protein
MSDDDEEYVTELDTDYVMNLTGETIAEFIERVKREEKERQKAVECGMDVQDWRRNRNLAKDSKSRGKRAPGTKCDFKDWGPVDGQLELFAE